MVNLKNDPLQCMSFTTRSDKIVGDKKPKNVDEANAKGRPSIAVNDNAIEDINDDMLDMEDLTLNNIRSDCNLKVGKSFQVRSSLSNPLSLI